MVNEPVDKVIATATTAYELDKLGDPTMGEAVDFFAEVVGDRSQVNKLLMLIYSKGYISGVTRAAMETAEKLGEVK